MRGARVPLRGVRHADAQEVLALRGRALPGARVELHDVVPRGPEPFSREFLERFKYFQRVLSVFRAF